MKRKKFDFFGSMERMGDAFAPKIRKSGYSDIGTGIPSVNISDPLWDPYKKSMVRQANKFMHKGPAQGKKLNDKQVENIVHDLKEKRYKVREAAEAIMDAKKMSRTHMNSSWGAIPKKSQKKYAKMDFDGDGIININDCFPFDFDRQYNYNKMSYGDVKASGYANVSAAKKAGYVPPRKGVPYIDYTVPTGPITGPFTISSGGGTTGTKPSGSGGGGGSSYIAPTPQVGTYNPATLTYISSTGEISSMMPNFVPKGTKISKGVYNTSTKTYIDESGNKFSRAGTNLPAGTAVIDSKYDLVISGSLSGGYQFKMPGNEVEYFQVYLEDYVPGWEGMTDYDKYAALREQIELGKITDPTFITKYEKLLAPYINRYKSQIKGAEAATVLRQKKIGFLGRAGEENLLSQKHIKRVQAILDKKIDKIQQVAETKEQTIARKKEAELENIVTSELSKRKSEYYTPGKAGEIISTFKGKMTKSEFDAYNKSVDYKAKFKKLINN